jgi:DinB superfamily
MTAAVDELLARLEAVERRLVEHADAPLPSGLTEPDPGGEERWEAGQVWAHLAEFPGYWLGQAQRVIALPTNEPVPFGRVKTDTVRIEAIERDRHTDPAALLERVRASLADVTDTARSLPPEAWTRRGMHPVRGELSVQQIFEQFIANHLEEHADQLDSLAAPGTSTSRAKPK